MLSYNITYLKFINCYKAYLLFFFLLLSENNHMYFKCIHIDIYDMLNVSRRLKSLNFWILNIFCLLLPNAHMTVLF